MAIFNLDNISDIIRNTLNQKFYFLKEKKIEKGTDLDLIYQIQPIQGFKPESRFWHLGDGYGTCIHLFAAPEKVSRFWLYQLYKLENVITTFDVRALNVNDTKEKIKRSMDENISRLNTDDVLQYKDAQINIDKLDELLDEMNRTGIVLALDMRVYVYGRSFYEMEKNVETVMQQLAENGFTNYGRCLNEQTNEYLSLFVSPTQNLKTLSGRQGIPVPAHIMAQALPFYYVGLNDPNGYYVGDAYTSSGIGTVVWNPFYKDKYRASYDAILCGEKGTGKSTTLKNLIEMNVATGNRVRVIDVTGEFENVIKNLNGIVIKFDSDGSTGKLNLLEILKMDENDTLNYTQHISKMSHIFRLMCPDYTQSDVDEFKIILKKLYVKFGLIQSEDALNFEGLTGLPNNKYPIFNDLLNLINEEILTYESVKSETAKYKIQILLKIRSSIESLITSYGSLFNGYTNIPNIVDADAVSFDISKVTGIEQNVFDMQLFNVLSMAYDSCMAIGTKMKKLHDAGAINDIDIVHHVIIIDECHMSINARQPYAIKTMLDIMRQDRKFYIGVYLATQNIADMCRSSDDNATKDIKTLFELCQYKLMFRQDAATKVDLQNAFSDILTNLQIKNITKLENRELFLILSPKESIRFTAKAIPAYKLAYYGGGA